MAFQTAGQGLKGSMGGDGDNFNLTDSDTEEGDRSEKVPRKDKPCQMGSSWVPVHRLRQAGKQAGGIWL